MTQMLNFRATEADLLALESARATGESTSDVLRRALRALLVLDDRARLRAESQALAADADDLAEVRAVREQMDQIGAW